MRFGFVHRLMTDTLAVLGLLALLTSGNLNRTIALAIAVGLVAALAIPARWQDRAWLRRLAVIAPLAWFALEATRMALGAPLLPTAVEFAAGLQVLRLATRRGASHDQQVIVLALLHLVAGTVLGAGLAYGFCFVGFLIIAPGALVLSHLRREVEGNYRQGARDRTGLPVDVPRILRSRRVIGRNFLLFTCLLSIPIFLFTAFLFVLFPRVGLSLLLLGHNRSERMIGFSDRVDLGGVGKLRSDPAIAMRVQYDNLPANPPPRLALYLRGTAFDHYDGRTWVRTQTRLVPVQLTGRYLPLERYPSPETDRRARIELEPIDPPVLFLPAHTVALRIEPEGHQLFGRAPTILAGPEHHLRYAGAQDRGVHYDAYVAPGSAPDAHGLGDAERSRYLSLPPGLSPRVSALAHAWTAGLTSPLAQARAVEARLRKEYAYDLDSPAGAAPDPLEHFLFESRRGHCEYYSTAMAIMLRTLDVPTRNVTGFIGGTYNRFGGFYAVRQGDAHSWVEAHIDGSGWQHFDPTPPASAAPQTEIGGVLAFARDLLEAAAQRWSRHVVGYDLPQQLRLFRSARRTYSRLRTNSPLIRDALASPRRAALLLAGLVLVAGGIYWLRQSRKPRSQHPEKPDPERISALQVVALYRQLESAMSAHGVPRHLGTPPLAHARALAQIQHPIAPEVAALTDLYLVARFGGQELSEPDRKDFARRVRLLRQLRETPAREAA